MILLQEVSTETLSKSFIEKYKAALNQLRYHLTLRGEPKEEGKIVFIAQYLPKDRRSMLEGQKIVRNKLHKIIHETFEYEGETYRVERKFMRRGTVEIRLHID